MKQEHIHQLTTDFEGHAQKTESGVEFWLARDLQVLLGYSKWDNFLSVIAKAKVACEGSGNDPADHFPDVGKLVVIGSGSHREVDDIMLTRYACYLIAQNGDPRKSEVAFAQTYFAIQTRRAELIEQRLLENERVSARRKLTETEKELSKIIFEQTGDSQDFAKIRSKGDHALFEKNTQSMKAQWNVQDNRPLPDFAPTIILKAKDFASEITIHNARENQMSTEHQLSNEHVANNSAVRNVLLDRGIRPEALSAAEDVKKVERRLTSEDKRAFDQPEGLENETHG